MRGARVFGQSLIALAVCLAVPTLGRAQIAFHYDFAGPSDFNGSASNPGYYTAERQAAIERAGAYITSQFDGRGTVNVKLGTQSDAQVGNGTLAIGGTQYFLVNGAATNGTTFASATSNNARTSSHTSIDFNSDQTNWFTGPGSSAGSGAFDMQSIALHEITHSLGFSSLLQSDGTGLGGHSTWSQFDANLRVGSGVNAPPVLTGSQGNYAFNSGAVTTADLNGNNLYFRGEFAVAAFGGAVPLAGSGDRSHLGSAVTSGVMLPAVAAGTDRRAYTNAELGMLIDMGWNQFVWKNDTGNFADNVSDVTTNSRWQNLDGQAAYSPVGTITPNMVLRFGGTGGYTATNDLTLVATTATGMDANRFLVTRLILNATAGTSTLAATGTNTLRFDSTIGVAPQIRQDGAGAFNVTHPLELTGRNLELTGNGGGAVTLAGTIGQQSGQVGALTKSGDATFILSGANSYTGGTAINGGELRVANTTGSATGSGAVTVNAGGYLSGTGIITGATTVNAGGGVRGGSGANGQGTGTLTLGDTTLVGATGTTGATLAVDLAQAAGNIGSNTPTSTLKLDGHTLNFANVGGSNKVNILLLNDGNLSSIATPFTITLATGTAGKFERNGTAWDATTNPFTAADFNVISGSGKWVYGNLTLEVSGNNLVLQFQPVPEPALVLTVGVAGLAGFGWLRRRKRRAAEPTAAA